MHFAIFRVSTTRMIVYWQKTYCSKFQVLKHDLRWRIGKIHWNQYEWNTDGVSQMITHTNSLCLKLKSHCLQWKPVLRNVQDLGIVYPQPQLLQNYNINPLTIITIKLNQTLRAFNFELHLDFARLTLNFDLQCDLGCTWFCSQHMSNMEQWSMFYFVVFCPAYQMHPKVHHRFVCLAIGY